MCPNAAGKNQEHISICASQSCISLHMVCNFYILFLSIKLVIRKASQQPIKLREVIISSSLNNILIYDPMAMISLAFFSIFLVRVWGVGAYKICETVKDL